MRRTRSAQAVPLTALLFLILAAAAGAALAQAVETDYRALASANRRAGRVRQALYYVEAESARAGWSPDLLRLAGDLWLEAGGGIEALPYWQAAAAAQPDDRSLLRQVAQANIALARWPAAADALLKLLDSAPGDPWAHYQLGLMRAAHDPDAARAHLAAAARGGINSPVVSALQEALAADTDIHPGMRAGRALLAAGLWSHAELAFRRAAAEAAPYADALAYAAVARLRQGKDAKHWAEQAALLGPASASAQYAHGLYLRAAGQLEASRAALARAAALDPSNPVYYAELGDAYRLIGDLSNAARWLGMAVSISGGERAYQEALALFYAETGYSPPAAGALLADHPDVRAENAWKQHLIGESEAALAELDSVLEQDADNARALFYKAEIVLALRDDRAEAAALLRRAAAQESPFGAVAQRLLARLPGE
ncbi:MAG: tetratricopeptide repeat protein [Aggregatilineales bacterium]